MNGVNEGRQGRMALVSATLLAALVILFLCKAACFLPLLQPVEGGGWAPAVDATSNAYFMWRTDPLAQTLGGLLNADAICVNLLIFFLGSVALFACIKPGLPLNAVLNALLLSALLPVFGLNAFAMQALSYLPALCAALHSFRSGKKISAFHYLVLPALTLMLFFFAAGGLALMLTAFALIACAIMAPPAVLPPQGETQAESKKNTKGAVSLLILGGAVLFLLSLPALPFPDYPANAHLVPDDGLPGIIRPLLGPATPLPVINREALRTTFGGLAALLTIFSVSALLLARLAPPAAARRFAVAAILLSLAAYGDTRLTEDLSQIAPLASLSRLAPPLFLFPLSGLCLALVLLCLFMAAAAAGGKRTTAGLAALLLLAQLLFLKAGPLFNPALSLGQSAALLSEIRNLPNEALRNRLETAFFSPSRYLISKVGAAPLANQGARSSADFQPLNPSNVEISASHLNGSSYLVDGRAQGNRRWTPGRGFQSGDEWLHIFFKNRETVAALDLSPGKYASDFPRGLKLSYRANCRADEAHVENFKDYTPLVDLPDWQGEVLFTAAGFPFFDGQEKVRIYLPAAVELQCLLIQQTGRAPSFDWSVAEIRVLR